MNATTLGDLNSPSTDDAESIAINARDVLAGRWDTVRLGADR